MQCMFELRTHRTHSPPDWERDQPKNKKKQTPHFRTYSQLALFDLPKLCMMVELLVPIIKGVIHFSI